MSQADIIRAWRDEDYRMSLTETELAQLPESPVGLIELTEADLDYAAGGADGLNNCTCGCCTCGCPPH